MNWQSLQPTQLHSSLSFVSSLDNRSAPNMRCFHFSVVAASSWLLLGVVAKVPSSAPVFSPDSNGKYWIHGEGIAAAFIPYGASVSNLVIKDKNGIARDIVMGYDNASYYAVDKVHPHLGGVPGRYANRIKNSTFELDGQVFHISANENPTKANPQGIDTLHGGLDGWDWREFEVVAHTNNSVTFSIVDPDGKEGFPGEVISYITYTMGKLTWNAKMVAIATTKKTPIMLSSHTYWNLDGFANNQTRTVFNHTLHLPHSGQRVAVDNILIPTGEIANNAEGSVNDFWSAPKQIGRSFDDPEIHGNCGFNCTGYGTYTNPLHSPSPSPLTRNSRQLLAGQPPRPARLARRRRLRRQPRVGLVRHPARHLLGTGGLPDVLVQRPGRLVPGQDDAGPAERPRVSPDRAQVWLCRARGAGLDRRHQPPRVGAPRQAGH